MRKAKPCAVCQNTTTKLLFGEKILNTPICTRKCMYEYISSLDANAKEQINVLRYLDEKIEDIKKLKRIGWLIAGFGLAIVTVAFFVKDANLFMFGLVPMSLGALSTSHFEDQISALLRLRKRILV